MRRTVGAEVDAAFEDDGEDEYPHYLFPVESLCQWIAKNGGLDPEWLRTDKGRFIDDHGVLVPRNVKPLLSGAEQLAAFGLWLIEDDMLCCGPDGEADWDARRINPHGIPELDVLDHKAECLLLAYQALSAAHELLQGKPAAMVDAKKGADFFDFSVIGRKGAISRHAPMKALKEFALAQYSAGTWTSVDKAAKALTDRVVAHGRTIGATLTTNAPRTIAKWIYIDNKTKKKPDPPFSRTV